MFTVRFRKCAFPLCQAINASKPFRSQTYPVIRNPTSVASVLYTCQKKDLHLDTRLSKTKGKGRGENPPRNIQKQMTLKLSKLEQNSTPKNSETENVSSKIKNSTKKRKKAAHKNFIETGIKEVVKEVAAELHPSIEATTQRETSQFELLSQLLKINKTSEDADTGNDASAYLDGLKKSNVAQRTEEETDADFSPLEFHNHKKRLNIFETSDAAKPSVKDPSSDTSKWTAVDWYNDYQSNAIKMLHDRPYPSNEFEEISQLMDQGKLWKFPIDNEQGMEEEQKIPFHEHVFLDHKLNEGDWCPEAGPIRQFMATVTTALSSNPHLTVKEKHAHIEWFRDYFNEKRPVLDRLGLLDKKKSVQI